MPTALYSSMISLLQDNQDSAHIGDLKTAELLLWHVYKPAMD
jgi:hypothetical protein